MNFLCKCRWHGKGLLRLAEGGEVAGVWKNGKREGKVTMCIIINTFSIIINITNTLSIIPVT